MERKGFRPRFAAAVIAVLWLIAIVVFGIVQHLIDPQTFDDVWLGMWWATQTVTTVGYGDTVPQQLDGRLIAAVLMIGGLSLFAVVTGTITSVFVSKAQEERGTSEHDLLVERLDRIDADLGAIREQLSGRATGDPGKQPHD